MAKLDKSKREGSENSPWKQTETPEDPKKIKKDRLKYDVSTGLSGWRVSLRDAQEKKKISDLGKDLFKKGPMKFLLIIVVVIALILSADYAGFLSLSSVSELNIHQPTTVFFGVRPPVFSSP